MTDGFDRSIYVTGGTRRRRASLLAGAQLFIGLTLLSGPLAANAQVTDPTQDQDATKLTQPPGPADPAQARSSAPEATAVEGDILVTASRRTESATRLPFNISAYGSEQIERNNITSVAALSSQIPGFVVIDTGARGVEGSVPIIRGINSSGATGVAPRYFQSPVGLYQGNAPIVGALPLVDLERVEVLRGPQGTLYGAGALSGAVRFVPQSPKLGKSEGYVTVTGSDVSYSDKYGYDILGALNIPIGNTAAVRVVGKYEYMAGYIDVFDVLRRTGDDYGGGTPLLANPGDVPNSPGVYFDAIDSNYVKNTAVRIEGLWKVTDLLKLEGSFSYAKYDGVGGPLDNFTYQGGLSPVDPRRTLRPTGKYERSVPTLEPFSRDSKLTVLDASYDFGFATLSGTASFGDTSGEAIADASNTLLGSPAAPYYTGTPANPRPAINATNYDDERTNTQELRLISSPGNRFDYVVGLFLQQQDRHRGLDVWNPGADTYTAAANGGSTVPIAAGGTYIPLQPNGAAELQDTYQRFSENAIFGDLTFHVTDEWQITGGARLFRQRFRQMRMLDNAPFAFQVSASNEQSGSSQIFKANTSYQFSPSNQIYATFSQGYRRGGGNAFTTQGPLREPDQLAEYVPDKTNNYEVGIKGVVSRIRYSANLFYVDWRRPQIDTTTPFTIAYVVINGNKAVSKGIEAEAAGPIGVTGLSVNVGFSYARARLSESFSLPAGDGGGGVVPGAIIGTKGDRLPGAPDLSGSATINYEKEIGFGGSVLFSLGADYRSSTVSNLPIPGRPRPFFTAPAYTLFRGSIGFRSDDWELSLFGNNLTNKHVVLVGISRSAASISRLGGWGDYYTVSKPREVGLRLTRRF